MNTIRINSASLNRVGLNVIGEIRISAGGGGGGDVPSYENGVYIQHIDGKLYTENEWTSGGFSNDDANGVAVITDNARFVIAKTNVGTGIDWSSNPRSLVDGIMVTTDPATAKTDFSGYNNTQSMLATDTSGAGFSCANFTFPNGAKGYLPALGEWNEAYANKSKIDSALKTIGGMRLYSRYYWSSTQYTSNFAWSLYTSDGTTNYDTKGNGYYVRAFTTLD